MDTEYRDKIISAYGMHLEAKKSAFGRESDLPYPKNLIRQALVEELATETNPKLIEVTEACFLCLEDFVSDDEYILVQRYECLLAQRDSILKSDGTKVMAFANDMADASTPMLAIMDRSVAHKKERMQQLAAIRAQRDGSRDK